MKDAHYNAVRKNLAQIEALSQSVKATNAQIRDAAQKRLEEVRGQLEKASQDDGDAYLKLIEERAALHRVLGRG